MTGVRVQGERVREFLLEGIVRKEPSLVAAAIRHFGISRQAVLKHVDRLRQQNAIVVSGTKQKPLYDLVPIKQVYQTFFLADGLAEHEVWEEFLLPIISTLPGNVVGIWAHAFTEMFNNAVEFH